MADSAAHPSDASQSPVTDGVGAPTPRLATPASETADESVRAEGDAVDDAPDTGGLTSTDDAQ